MTEAGSERLDSAQLAPFGPGLAKVGNLPDCANFRCGHEGPLRAHEPSLTR